MQGRGTPEGVSTSTEVSLDPSYPPVTMMTGKWKNGKVVCQLNLYLLHCIGQSQQITRAKVLVWSLYSEITFNEAESVCLC